MLLTIHFAVTLYLETSTPYGDIIFYIVAFSIIYGLVFLVSYLVGYKQRRQGISLKNNVAFVNCFLFTTLFFYVFELYFLKFRFVIFPPDGIYGDTQIITDDKNFRIGHNIIFIDQCVNQTIENNLKGRINIVVKSLNFSEKTTAGDTIYKSEILYLLNNEKVALRYYKFEFDSNCKTISTEDECSEERMFYLLDRAKQDEIELKKYEKYIR